MTMRAAMVAIGVLISPALGAQSKPADAGNLTFEVVSVKSNKTGGGRHQIGRQPGGRWAMVNVTTSGLILSAYPTKIHDLVGAPSWVTSDPYDVEARATFVPTPEQERMMLRALLADRFKLAAHYETHERPIYNLVVARADGRLGPQLRRIDIDCATYKPLAAARDTPAPPVTDAPVCGYRMRGGTTLSIVSGGLTLQTLADSISNMAGRPIFDKTGMSGYYAFTLSSIGGTDDLSIFTALQEQLGLKLEPTRGPVDVVVIDRIERPTEN